MATRASITVGDIGWTTVGRLVTGALVLYVVAIALVYDGSCFPSCDNVRFWVMFLPLGFFGVVLCLLAGNSVAAGTVQRRNVFNASVGIYFVASIIFLVSFEGLLLGMVYLVVAGALFGANPFNKNWHQGQAARILQ
jgi:hypothetical protein